jgi:hypothetical protein
MVSYLCNLNVNERYGDLHTDVLQVIENCYPKVLGQLCEDSVYYLILYICRCNEFAEI